MRWDGFESVVVLCLVGGDGFSQFPQVQAVLHWQSAQVQFGFPHLP
jgi:hypothetical protein